MSAEDVFSAAWNEPELMSIQEVDAALAGRIHLYLRSAFDSEAGCWRGRDEHDTLRRTCHAAEVLHSLHLDADSASMVRDAGNWLVNLPIRDRLAPAERTNARLYPSRFKTLAYLGRFDDDLVRRDFADLLGQAIGGMIRGVTESDILTTCIALDTLLSLEDAGIRHEVCTDERFGLIVRALGQQLRLWRPAGETPRIRRNPHAAAPSALVRTRKRSGSGSEITNPRDLSYVIGLLLRLDRLALAPRQIESVTGHLVAAIEQRDRARGTDLAPVLYAALQVAEHCRDGADVRRALEGLLAEIRNSYMNPEAHRRWEFSHHTQVMRLLVTLYGPDALAQRVVARLLRAAEQRRDDGRDTLVAELTHVIQERITIELGEVTELSGGFTSDHIYRVPFTYWYPMPGNDSEPRRGSLHALSASVIIKRSTSDAFHTALENYRMLPPAVRDMFVRQPSEMQVYRSGLSPAYYLTMEDLDNMRTLDDLMGEWDQRAMHDQHMRLLTLASERLCSTSLTLFRSTMEGRGNFIGTQIARLYLSSIEAKLARAVSRVPWLKNPIQGYIVGEMRFRGLDYYLSIVSRHAQALQPRTLGLTHGDLHAGNVMLDRTCTQIKLIDLDKISWTGDYLADVGNLITDVCVYRRVAHPMRDFGLAREEIVFSSRSTEPGTAENSVRYPALGRPATMLFQERMFPAIAAFAEELGDSSWKSRLWLAAATALCVRLSFQTDKEPSAVLYAEAIRLLHELCRHLEQGHDLPTVLIPAVWSSPVPTRSSSDLPEWIASSTLLAKIHEGLRELGLLAVRDHSSVAYHWQHHGDGPAAKLVEPRREGIARLLLPAANVPEIQDGVRIVHSGQGGDALGTILIVTESTDPADVLRIAGAYINRAVDVRVR